MEKIFLGLVIAFGLAEGIKLLANCIKNKKISLKEILRDGGMPSAHTSFVSALLIGLYLETGFSYYTLIAFAFFVVVINDALKVRWTTGLQSKAINEISKGKYQLDEQGGHKPLEVIAGFILGSISAFIAQQISLFL
jgi:acid phosphatase family membrane protein YuiD